MVNRPPNGYRPEHFPPLDDDYGRGRMGMPAMIVCVGFILLCLAALWWALSLYTEVSTQAHTCTRDPEDGVLVIRGSGYVPDFIRLPEGEPIILRRTASGYVDIYSGGLRFGTQGRDADLLAELLATC